MYYIEQENDEYVKYEVFLDEEKLENLRNKIIWNCGEIIPQCYQSRECKVNFYDIVHIHNFNEEFIKWYEPNDFYSPDEKIYEYSYEEYKDTKLSLLVDSLLKGDTSVIEKIKNPKLDRKKASIKKPKKDLSKLLSLPIDTIDTREIEALKIYQNYQKLNKDRKSEREYYPLVLACIHMTEVERISITKVIEWQTLMQQTINILEELKPFFNGTNHEDILSLGLKKEL